MLTSQKAATPSADTTNQPLDTHYSCEIFVPFVRPVPIVLTKLG